MFENGNGLCNEAKLKPREMQWLLTVKVCCICFKQLKSMGSLTTSGYSYFKQHYFTDKCTFVL